MNALQVEYALACVEHLFWTVRGWLKAMNTLVGGA